MSDKEPPRRQRVWMRSMIASVVRIWDDEGMRNLWPLAKDVLRVIMLAGVKNGLPHDSAGKARDVLEAVLGKAMTVEDGEVQITNILRGE